MYQFIYNIFFVEQKVVSHYCLLKALHYFNQLFILSYSFQPQTSSKTSVAYTSQGPLDKRCHQASRLWPCNVQNEVAYIFLQDPCTPHYAKPPQNSTGCTERSFRVIVQLVVATMASNECLSHHFSQHLIIKNQ